MNAQTVEEYVKTHPPKEFNPKPVLINDARQITWFWSNEMYYAETALDKDGNAVGTFYWVDSQGYPDQMGPGFERKLIGCTIFLNDKTELLESMKEYINKQMYLY